MAEMRKALWVYRKYDSTKEDYEDLQKRADDQLRFYIVSDPDSEDEDEDEDDDEAPYNFVRIFEVAASEYIKNRWSNAASRLFHRPSNMFPKVKTPAAYMRVQCYPPARFSEGFFSRGI